MPQWSYVAMKNSLDGDAVDFSQSDVGLSEKGTLQGGARTLLGAPGRTTRNKKLRSGLLASLLGVCGSCSRMRSEGFPFIVGGLGVGPVFAWLASSRRLSSSVVVSRRLSSSLVVSRCLPSFVVVVASQICCHWGKLLQVTFHGCVTCQFAPLFHCD